MIYTNRQITLAARTVLIVSIITTFVTIFSMSVRHNFFVYQQDTSISFDNVDESFLHFASSSKSLISKIENVVKYEMADLSYYSQFIIREAKLIKDMIEGLHKHIDTRAIKVLLSLPIINKHDFPYIHNPVDTCSFSRTNVLFVLPSATTNFEKRMQVRNSSRGDYIRTESNNAKMLFFLGRTSLNGSDSHIQQDIDTEAKEYGDIVQVDFEDIYRNNRLKSVSMLKWISEFCSTVKFIIRSDDDIRINVSSLVAVLDMTSKQFSNFIIGHKLVNDPPCRDVNMKYYMSPDEYSENVLPPYLLGGLQGYPGSTAMLLYEAALRVKPVWLEDVYITGMCAARVHIPILGDPEFIFQHAKS